MFMTIFLSISTDDEGLTSLKMKVKGPFEEVPNQSSMDNIIMIEFLHDQENVSDGKKNA